MLRDRAAAAALVALLAGSAFADEPIPPAPVPAPAPQPGTSPAPAPAPAPPPKDSAPAMDPAPAPAPESPSATAPAPTPSTPAPAPAPTAGPGAPPSPANPGAPCPDSPAAPAPGATPPASGPLTRFRPEEPADALGAKVERFPDDLALALAYEDALLAEGRRDEADVVFGKRKQANPSDPGALVLWARLREPKDGREILTGVLKSTPALVEAHQALAEVEEAAGQLDAAKREAETVLGLRGSAYDWTYAGYLRERLGDRAGALEAYARATSIDPALLAPRLDRALLAAVDVKSATAALAEMEKDSGSDDPLWKIGLALVRMAAGRLDAARAALDQALSAAAGERRILLGVTAVAVRTKAVATARGAIDAALAKSPTDPDFLAARGVLALEANAPGEARSALDDASKLVPKDARVKYLLGIAELRLGHVDKALSAFKAAAALVPTSGRYALAVAHAMDRKGAKDVLVAWRHAWELDPKDPEPHICAALWLNLKGRFDEAAEQLEDALAIAPNEHEARYYLAIVHGDRLGLLGKALDDLREYKKRGGTDPNALAWLDALEEEQSK